MCNFHLPSHLDPLGPERCRSPAARRLNSAPRAPWSVSRRLHWLASWDPLEGLLWEKVYEKIEKPWKNHGKWLVQGKVYRKPSDLIGKNHRNKMVFSWFALIWYDFLIHWSKDIVSNVWHLQVSAKLLLGPLLGRLVRTQWPKTVTGRLIIDDFDIKTSIYLPGKTSIYSCFYHLAENKSIWISISLKNTSSLKSPN